MRSISILFVLAAVVVFSAPARAAAVQLECGSEKTGNVPWKYCIAVTPGVRNQDVLYHLHGRTGSERTWSEENYYTGMLRRAWSSRNVEAPSAVITLSFGPEWLLVPRNTSPYSGLLDLVVNIIIPTLERRIHGPMGRRFLLGESMGGFNSTVLALRGGVKFDRAALLCPPMTTLSPFAAEADIVAFIERTRATATLVRDAIRASRLFLPTPEDWDAVNPLALAAVAAPATSPKLYVSCGYYDEYGFFEGAERFAALTKARGIATTWRPVWGGHCATDIDSLAEFLAP